MLKQKGEEMMTYYESYASIAFWTYAHIHYTIDNLITKLYGL